MELLATIDREAILNGGKTGPGSSPRQHYWIVGHIEVPAQLRLAELVIGHRRHGALGLPSRLDVVPPRQLVRVGGPSERLAVPIGPNDCVRLFGWSLDETWKGLFDSPGFSKRFLALDRQGR
jgi:hypothetical protein